LGRLFPEVAAPELPPPSDDQRRLFESVAHLVEQLARGQPLAVLLEDLHWADEMSLRLLSFLGRRIASTPVLMIATARSEVIVETLRALGGASAALANPASSSLAEGVRGMIASRLERLSSPARALAAVAAIIGREFDFALLARAAEMPERDAAETLEELVRR